MTHPEADDARSAGTAIAAVTAIVAEEADIDPSDVGPTLDLQADLGLDVLSIWTIVTMVEDRLRVVISDAVVPTLQTVTDLAAYVDAALAPPAQDPS